MLETLALILWLALCYVAGYLFGMLIAEWLNNHWFHQELRHV